jgi:hypothetical protein
MDRWTYVQYAEQLQSTIRVLCTTFDNNVQQYTLQQRVRTTMSYNETAISSLLLLLGPLGEYIVETLNPTIARIKSELDQQFGCQHITDPTTRQQIDLDHPQLVLSWKEYDRIQLALTELRAVHQVPKLWSVTIDWANRYVPITMLRPGQIDFPQAPTPALGELTRSLHESITALCTTFDASISMEQRFTSSGQSTITSMSWDTRMYHGLYNLHQDLRPLGVYIENTLNLNNRQRKALVDQQFNAQNMTEEQTKARNQMYLDDPLLRGYQKEYDHIQWALTELRAVHEVSKLSPLVVEWVNKHLPFTIIQPGHLDFLDVWRNN